MKLRVEVNEDEFFAEKGSPAIVGPGKDREDGAAWLLYFPGEIPCICDDFSSACRGMEELLAKRDRMVAKKNKKRAQ